MKLLKVPKHLTMTIFKTTFTTSDNLHKLLNIDLIHIVQISSIKKMIEICHKLMD